MPEMHLKQPEFTYSACGPFTKYKEKIKNFKETRHSWYIYQIKLDKVCFQNDMAYADVKDLNRRTAADKVLRDKRFNTTKNLNCDGYQRRLYKFFNKKTSGGAATVAYKYAIKNEYNSNK